MVEDGRFRADLYFRLAVFPLRVPPLREHVEDLPLIADAWLERQAAASGTACRGHGGRPARLRAYPWPGNVRELQNVLEFALLRAGGGRSTSPTSPRRSAGPRGAAGGREAAPTARGRGPLLLDRDMVLSVLQEAGGNRAEAARRLGISRVTLWKRLKQYGLDASGEPRPE